MSDDKPLLDLRDFVPALAGGGWRGGVRNLLERVLGLVRVREMTAELSRRVQAGADPLDTFLALAGVELCDGGVQEALPRHGGAVVVCNHPFGGADALAILTLVARVRKDTRIIANDEVTRIDAVAPFLFPMDIRGREGAERRNVAMMRKALAWLQEGGVLVVFPAGAVAHWQWRAGRVEDPVWSPHAARLILKAGVPVLPVRFFGENPAWFQLLGVLHPLVRSALIPRAFLAKRGERVYCRPGRLFTPAQFPPDPSTLTEQLRGLVEQVSERNGN